MRLREIVAAKKKEDKTLASKPSQRNSLTVESDAIDSLSKCLPPAPPVFTISSNSSLEDSAQDLSRKMSDHSQPVSLHHRCPVRLPKVLSYVTEAAATCRRHHPASNRSRNRSWQFKSNTAVAPCRKSATIL